MKLKNKKTGEIKECVVIPVDSNGYPNEYQVFEKGESLAELNEEWEDYEEPKTFWAISWAGEPEEYDAKNTPEELKNMAKQIGNYFETEEEAELAVRKLKAWKRLKDNGLKAFSSKICGDDFVVNFKLTNHTDYSQSIDDFDCIFDLGGEE